MHKKTFRLFVSSTFSDFTEERRLLQQYVFPELKKYTSSKGYTFQPIDLRWGVTNEAQLDQKTLELCIEEVQTSKLQPHPNFLIMAGDRYGWIPLPYAIEQNEFETILTHTNDEEKEFLNEWYQLDTNQLPISYILKEREDKYIDYNEWEKVENKIRNIFQTIVPKSNFDEDTKSKYFTSATEYEVIEGIFKYLNPTEFQQTKLLEIDKDYPIKDEKYIYGYLRNINLINDKHKSQFIDENLENVNRFKQTIKNSLNPNNIFEVDVDISITDDIYSYEQIQNEENSLFVRNLINHLKNSVDEYISTHTKELSQEELEKYERERFKDDKLKLFIGREKDLKAIDEYINSDEKKPFVLYGQSGIGKTALISKAIEKTNKTNDVIYRFVGVTSSTNFTSSLLLSILKELGIEEERKTIINIQTGQKEPEPIEEFYYRINNHLKNIQNKIIFIDAIDQIDNEDEFLWLPKELNNLKIIISTLDDENYPQDSKYFQTLKTFTKTHKVDKFESPKEYILTKLKEYKRTLTDKQIEYILSQTDSIKPLYLSVAIQEVRHWKSFDNSQTLSPIQKEIISEYISNLTTLYHHDEELVKRVFSYIYLSNGLSESEIIEILSTDEEFINKIAPDTFHKNITKDLPMSIWVRLHYQIKGFFKVENKDGVETMNFFHREFKDVLLDNEDKLSHENLISLLQTILSKHQYEDIAIRWANVYIEVIKNYHLKYEFKYELDEHSKLKEYSEFLAELENERFLSDLVFIMITKISNVDILYYLLLKLYKKNPNKWINFIELYLKKLNDLIVSLKNMSLYSESIKINERIKKIFLKINEKINFEHLNILQKEYLIFLNNLIELYYDINHIKKVKELFRESLRIIKSLYENNPSEWQEKYITSLNNLAYSYYKIEKVNETIKLNEEILNITNNLNTNNQNIIQVRKNAIEFFESIAKLFEMNYKQNKTIDSLKKLLSILKTLYKINSNKWAKKYLHYLNKSGSEYIKNEDFKKAYKHFKEYLNIFDIQNITSVQSLKFEILPFVKYYQLTMILNKDLSNLDKYIQTQTSYFKNKFGDEYYEEIENLYKGYEEFANNSDEKFAKHRFEIFKKLFYEKAN